jgi:hypothetical protein
MVENFDWKGLVESSRSWFNESSRAWMWEEPRAKLRELLETPTARDCGKAIGLIRKLGYWHAREACVMIGDGQARGWQEMRRHIDYGLWILHREVERVRLSGGRGPLDADPTRKPFHLLAMAMSFQDWNQARWLGGTITGTRGTKLFGYWYRDPLCCYVTTVCARGLALSSSGCDLGIYREILQAWDSPPKLADAIRAACDYHLARTNTGNPSSVGEFEDNPQDIFPAEILALHRVRERLGLVTPSVKHPLLETPFAQVPQRTTYEPDPLVVAAMGLVEKLLPDAVMGLRCPLDGASQ